MREKAQALLKRRALAYQRVFLGHGPDTNAVLDDLAKFCRAHESTFHVEPTMSDRLDGRREVWLRLQHHLRLSDDQLWYLYGNHALPPDTKEEST
ncbi:MAG: hypothetical protein OEV08_00870 [Nitrospira sp.]|nr:hypothetical protein [Nitrospira sp.]